MELRQLRYFKAIADANSFARGAQELRVAQPALSRSIAKLEVEIGHVLFVRHSAGVSLTDSGVTFYEYAMSVLTSVKNLTEGMAAEDDVLRGEVKLGAPQSILSKLVLPVAGQFLTQYPHCKLDLIQNSSLRLRDRVLEGLLDLAIVVKTTESGVYTTPLLQESIGLICRREDRSLFAKQVELGDILDKPLILSGYPDSLRLYIDRKFPHQADALDVRCEVNGSLLLTDLVMRKVGYGIGPSCVIAQRPHDELAFVPIVGLDVTWVIAVNWSRRGLRAVTEIENLLVRHAKDAIENNEWPTAHVEF